MNPSRFKPPKLGLLTLIYVTEYFVAGWKWQVATNTCILHRVLHVTPQSWAGWSLDGEALSQHTAQRDGQAAICEEQRRDLASSAVTC